MNNLIQITALAEGVGIVGFCLYVITYGLLAVRLLAGHSFAYLALNLLAASCVLISLTVSFNLASALTQIFWITVSLIGITLNARRGAP